MSLPWAILLLFRLVVGQQWPKWVPAAAKDLLGELDENVAESKASVFGEYACDIRVKLLKVLGPVTGPEKGQIMMTILGDLGQCELKGGNHAAAMRRYESAISELNVPNEDMLLQNTQTAPLVLMRDAFSHIRKQDASRAAVEIRRTHTILKRDKAKVVKQVAKQNKVPAEQMDNFVKTVFEKQKAGGQEAQQVKPIVRLINQFDASLDNLENTLKDLDAKIASGAGAKEKRQRLEISSGPFVPAVLMEKVIESESSTAAEGLLEKASVIDKEVKEAQLTGSTSLLKRTKDGSGCAKLPETCAAVKEFPDIATNGFGETKVVVLKKGKKQALDLCDSNANIMIVMPLDGAVSVIAGDNVTPKVIAADTAVAVDHCHAVSLLATDDAVSVLTAQMWHPEIATIERTDVTREKAKKWGLNEAEIKDLTAQINAYGKAGKKGWEGSIKTWQAGPPAKRLRSRLEVADASKREAKDTADRNAEEKARSEDTERAAALVELQKKREAREQGKELKEKERLEKKRLAEEEKAKSDPWLLDPAVKEAEEKLEALKQDRRDSNAKLEFDLTKDLTTQINAQERLVEKTKKKAIKAWKKGKTLGDSGVVEGSAKEDKSKEKVGSSELADAEKKLADLKKKKAKASEDEDFKLAKQLKKEQELLEKEVAALTTKSEL